MFPTLQMKEVKQSHPIMKMRLLPGVLAAVLLLIPVGANAQADSGGGVPVKHYHCVMFIVDHLVDTAPFTITGSGAYTDSNSKPGTYTFDAASSTLTFHGGNLDGQRAQYDTKTKHLHILGPSGRRVIECD
jgi:hypothetical protein